LNCPVL